MYNNNNNMYPTNSYNKIPVEPMPKAPQNSQYVVSEQKDYAPLYNQPQYDYDSSRYNGYSQYQAPAPATQQPI